MNARSRLPTPGPLPDSHALRARALAASWRRDRTVHRRRLAWRWVQWALWRYGLPALAGAAAVVMLLAQFTRWPDLLQRPPAHAVQTPAPQVPAPPVAEPAVQATSAVAPPPAPATPASTGADDALSLRLETFFGAVPATKAAASLPPVPADPDFRLQPDDYLHSKEP